MAELIPTFAVAMLLAAVHVTAPHLTPFGRASRQSWLSFAGGLSVGYVFIHVMPELAQHQIHRNEQANGSIAEGEIFLVALGGLAAFYALEHLARKTAEDVGEDDDDARSRHPGFWLHMLSFSLYSAIIGYVLAVREAGREPQELAFFGIALGLHFFVNDRSLMRRHGMLHNRYGCWILATAVLGGWGAGAATGFDGAAVGFLFAFVAGGIILNALKEELPEERKGRLSAFILGAGTYAVIGLLT